MAGRFDLIKNKKGKYRFNLKAGNGQVILSSESYESRASAVGGINSVKKNGIAAARFERRKGKNGQPYFVLIASNKEVIGRSEMYSSKSSMENGIKSVMKHAAKAAVVDKED